MGLDFLSFRTRGSSHNAIIVTIIPIVLSAAIHIANPIGFPNFHVDEGTYLKQAVSLIRGDALAEGAPSEHPDVYNHPYFGRLFLAALLQVVGYQHLISVPPSIVDVEFVQELYLAPRMLIGSLAVIDTFLIYVITRRRYGEEIGFGASMMFAVMPIGWLTSRILLEAIQLPFILTSVLFAVYANSGNYDAKRRQALIYASGLFLGLAIFTKVPAFCLIPLVGILVYRSCERGKGLRILGLWLLPVILVPMIWPLYALVNNDFDKWVSSVIWQTQRPQQPLATSLKILSEIDVITFSLGTFGVIYAALKRDLLVLLWALPFLIFMQLIGYVSYFHLVPLIPIFSIAGARMVIDLTKAVVKGHTKIHRLYPYVIISEISVFGLLVSALLVSTNVTQSQFEVMAFVTGYLADQTDDPNSFTRVTVVGDRNYEWIPRYVLQKENDYRTIWSDSPYESDKFLLIVDDRYRDLMKNDVIHGERLRYLYDNTHPIATFQNTMEDQPPVRYYTAESLEKNTFQEPIEIRANY
jgi:hypothetical protein